MTGARAAAQTQDVPFVAAEDPSPRAAGAPTFDQVFQQEFAYVFDTLRRLGVHPGELEDVTHDVFVAVHRHLGEYDPARPLKPWLFGIAFRTASDWRRRARHRREQIVEDPAGELVDQAPAADDALAAREARALVLAALEALELDRRAVLVLHDIDGQPVPEIAAALGIPLNTAYSRLRLAREDFAAAVRRARARERGKTS